MSATLLHAGLKSGAQKMPKGLVLLVMMLVSHHDATAFPDPVSLGSASSFVVLAGAGITVAGAVSSTSITGDIGTYPTLTITGLSNVILNGTNHAGDLATQNAKADLALAYNDAAGRSPTTVYPAIYDLGGLTLTNGVYNDLSSFGLTGTLTLDAQGDPNAVWIFQAGSTLTTAAGSQVALINGARASHVFWQVGSSATLGANSGFAGNILALVSITLATGARVDGRVLAQGGTVALDTNIISTNESPTAVVLFQFGAMAEGTNVVVRWRTASEVGTAGFDLYRKVSGEWVKVNEALIAAIGAPSGGLGASYSLVDPGAIAGGTYEYRLVEIEQRGGQREYGPYERTATHFELTSPVRATPEGMEVRWLSREGERYRVLRSTNLLDTAMHVLGEAIEPTPPENVFLDTHAAPLRVYRVEME